jgi:integrase
MKVSAALKGRPDSMGRVAVSIRIASGKIRRFKAIQPPIRILPKQFKDGRVINHPDKDLFNLRIKEAIIKAERSGGFDEPGTELLGRFIERTLKDIAPFRAEGNMRHYRSKFYHFLGFTGNIPLTSITTQTLNAYKSYLIKEGISGNTLWSYLKYVRTLINKADKENLISLNPLKGFEMPRYKDPAKRFLLKSEVDKIEKLKKLPPELDFCRLWFLIGCYTGLRYGDQNKFDKKKHIKGDRLTVYTSKKGELISLPLKGKIKELFEAVDYKPMHYSNTHYNRCLMQIGDIAGVGEITSHLARHTFGTLLADAGVSQEVAAKLMGHGSLKSTAVYYRVTNNRLDAELGKLL